MVVYFLCDGGVGEDPSHMFGMTKVNVLDDRDVDNSCYYSAPNVI